jgi:hypothetical protein
MEVTRLLGCYTEAERGPYGKAEDHRLGRVGSVMWKVGTFKVVVSHLILRPNRMFIVCVHRNQVYTYTVQKIDIE